MKERNVTDPIVLKACRTALDECRKFGYKCIMVDSEEKLHNITIDRLIRILTNAIGDTYD